MKSCFECGKMEICKLYNEVFSNKSYNQFINKEKHSEVIKEISIKIGENCKHFEELKYDRI